MPGGSLSPARAQTLDERCKGFPGPRHLSRSPALPSDLGPGSTLIYSMTAATRMAGILVVNTMHLSHDALPFSLLFPHTIEARRADNHEMIWGVTILALPMPPVPSVSELADEQGTAIVLHIIDGDGAQTEIGPYRARSTT